MERGLEGSGRCGRATHRRGSSLTPPPSLLACLPHPTRLPSFHTHLDGGMGGRRMPAVQQLQRRVPACLDIRVAECTGGLFACIKRSVAQLSAAQRSTAQHSTAQHGTEQLGTAQHSTAGTAAQRAHTPGHARFRPHDLRRQRLLQQPRPQPLREERARGAPGHDAADDALGVHAHRRVVHVRERARHLHACVRRECMCV